mmetsp:Transcript_69904/g.194413  ORF Transcript_69904/g.194413 Transcript_69904/m.194413 type:complete len:204 (-) Transcript_69904:1066-1677(-)
MATRFREAKVTAARGVQPSTTWTRTSTWNTQSTKRPTWPCETRPRGFLPCPDQEMAPGPRMVHGGLRETHGSSGEKAADAAALPATVGGAGRLPRTATATSRSTKRTVVPSALWTATEMGSRRATQFERLPMVSLTSWIATLTESFPTVDPERLRPLPGARRPSLGPRIGRRRRVLCRLSVMHQHRRPCMASRQIWAACPPCA